VRVVRKGLNLYKNEKYVLILAVLLMAGMVFNIRPAEAFKDSIHIEIDDKAFESLGFPQAYRKPVNLANVMQDLLYFWEPQYHGDRKSGETHEIAFNRTRDYIITQEQKIINLLQNGETLEAAIETGKALHAVQDFYSHSNFVELNETDRLNAKAALTNSTIRIPSNVEMCGFWTEPPSKPLPCSDNGSKYRPEDPLKYSHVDHNKDDPGSPAGTNDYEWANENATQHTIEFITQTWGEFLNQKPLTYEPYMNTLIR
jgi:hypothetical protein